MTNFIVPVGPPPNAYTLHKDRDGYVYVWNAGTPESRYGFRPRTKEEHDVADTLVAMLNQGSWDAIATFDQRLLSLAFQLMLRIW